MPHASTSKPVSSAKAAPHAASNPAKPIPVKSAPAAPIPDLQPGMGAVPHATGTTFRVWAPNAESVSVIGTFNEWNPEKNPLIHEDGGYWATNVPEVKAGDEYKFHLSHQGQAFDRNDPYARQVTHSAGTSVVHDPDFNWGDDHFQMPTWNELVIYELHVGTFNAPDKESVGTFLSVAEKLPYLRDLGINCIELLPATEFPGNRSWGYNPAHPFALESAYGGPQAFKEMVKQAHQHGIAVVLDVVYNHFGPSDLDLWQFDGWSENGGGGIYFYNDERAHTPWGDNRPDYGRSEVRQYIRDNALMWLNEYRCDGLRADAIAYVRNVKGEEDPEYDLPDGWSLMRWINEEIDKTMPWKITIAEDLRGNPAITEATAEGGQGFDSQWDGLFVYSIREALTIQEDSGRDMHAVAQALTQLYNDNAFRRVIYTESHDEVANGKSRVPEEIMPGGADHWFSKKRATLGAALVLTAPGIPMLFQGQEFLAEGAFVDTEPVDWQRVKEHGGLVHLYRDLIDLRRNLSGHTPGLKGQYTNVFHVNDEAKLIAFARWTDDAHPEDATVVLANFANQAHEAYAIGLPGPGHWQVRLNSDWQGYDGEFGDFDSFGMDAAEGEFDGYQWHGSIGVAAYAALILSR